MMKKSITKIVLAFILFFNLSLKAQTGIFVPELVNFDTAMQSLISHYDVSGGQLAITYHGRLVYNRGFGYADTATHLLVQPDNIFRLASVSKQITSVAIMHLMEQGLIHLDDTVFGPDGILNDANYQNILDPLVYNITVRELLTHSGGWDRNISGDPMFNSYAIATTMGVSPPADAVTVIEYVLSNQMLDFTPGTQYQYSNLGFCILGRVIEKITGQNYEDYVRNTILLPLNITDMYPGFNLQSNKLPNEVSYYAYPAAPYAYSVYDNVSLVPWPYGGFNIEAMDSHGAWVASAEDLCKFLVAVDGFPTKPDMLLQSTIDIMVSPSSTNANYALGWCVNTYNNWWHTGSLPGTTTEIVRGSNQLNWAILLNTRPYDPDPLTTAVDNLVWNVLPTIGSWPTFDEWSGVNNYESEPSISIYPNPIKDDLNLIIPEKANIMITGISGQIIYTSLCKAGESKLDLRSLSNGIYILKIKTDEGVTIKKIVKQ